MQSHHEPDTAVSGAHIHRAPSGVEVVLDDRAVPLVVDVDGTLVRSDLLWEGLVRLLFTRPTVFARVLLALRAGKVAFKRAVAEAAALDVCSMPLDGRVLEMIRAAQRDDRPVLLASGCAQRQAEELGAHLAVSAVLCADGDENMVGAAKAAALARRYERYDYIGNSTVDLPLWAAARRSYAVNAPAACIARLRRQRPDAVVIGSGPPLARSLVRAMRPHQWSKNVLLVVPAVAAHLPLLPATLVTLAVGFVAFCAIASSIYLINDIVDLERDRLHARKRERPLAAGELSLPHALLAAGGLALVAAALSAGLPPRFAALLAIYAATSVAYSLWLRTRLLVDVIVLAVLYTIRLVAGASLVAVALSPPFIAFAIFLFFALAVIKRVVELLPEGRPAGEDPPGRAYRVTDVQALTALGAAATLVSCLVYVLYVMSPDAELLYARPELLWFVLPLLLYWQARLWVFALRGSLHHDPITFALNDRVSLGVVALSATILLLAA